MQDGAGQVDIVIDQQIAERRLLSGAVKDCGRSDNDCLFFIGQRSSLQGGAFIYHGSIFRFQWTAFPTASIVSPNDRFGNLLLPDNSDAPASLFNPTTQALSMSGNVSCL